MSETIIYNPNEFNPNYITELSKNAESVIFDKILEKAKDLGVQTSSINLDKSYLLQLIKKYIPDRLDKINNKINENIVDASTEQILDKILNVDKIIKHDNKYIFIDITTGKASSIINKLKKINTNYKSGIFNELKCHNFIVLRINKDDEEISDDKVLNIFTQLENLNTFSSVIDLKNTEPTISKRYFTKYK